MIENLKQKWNSGNVGMTQLVTWGLGVLTFAGSMVYAGYSSNATRINATEAKLGGIDATVVTLDKRLERMEDILTFIH